MLVGEKEGAIIGEDKAYTARSEETKKALEHILKTLMKILDYFEAEHEEILKQANAELLNLSLAVAERILLKELENPSELLKRNVAEAMEEPQLAHREFFVEVEHPEAGRLRLPGLPYHYSGYAPPSAGLHRGWASTRRIF